MLDKIRRLIFSSTDPRLLGPVEGGMYCTLIELCNRLRKLPEGTYHLFGHEEIELVGQQFSEGRNRRARQIMHRAIRHATVVEGGMMNVNGMEFKLTVQADGLLVHVSKRP